MIPPLTRLRSLRAHAFLFVNDDGQTFDGDAESERVCRHAASLLDAHAVFRLEVPHQGRLLVVLGRRGPRASAVVAFTRGTSVVKSVHRTLRDLVATRDA